MKYVLALALVFGFAAPAFAADGGKPPKALVEDLSKAAHEALITVKNPEGQTVVKPEDAKKLKYPLTPYDEREMAVARGYLSAHAKWCGLKWETDYFQPYQAALRAEHQKKWTPFQYAYSEVLHGVAMGVAETDKKGEKCSAAEKKRIAALAKK